MIPSAGVGVGAAIDILSSPEGATATSPNKPKDEKPKDDEPDTEEAEPNAEALATPRRPHKSTA